MLSVFYGDADFTRNKEVPKYVAQALIKYPGSGQVLDLDIHRFTQSAVVHVQCRECGSIRKGVLKKEQIVCRDHEKLRGRSTHTGPRWVEQEGQWNVVTSATT